MDKEQRLARIRKSLAEATAKAELEIKVIESLPEGIDPEYVYPHAYKGEAGIKLKVQDRKDVAHLLKILPPVPLVRFRDGCLSWFPEERLSEKDRGEATPVAAFLWRIEQTNLYPREVHMDWWTQLSDLLVSVRVVIEKDPAHYLMSKERFLRSEAYREFAAFDLPVGYRDYFWSTSSSPKPITVSWDRGVSFAVAMDIEEEDDAKI